MSDQADVDYLWSECHGEVVAESLEQEVMAHTTYAPMPQIDPPA